MLCWIMTSDANLNSKAKHVRNTWGKRCNKLLFVSDHEDPSFPTLPINTGTGRGHLLNKTMRAFDYVYKNHFEDADWFMKADDDTYVIMENLRYFLSEQDPSEPVYFGRHILMHVVPQGYQHGGGGYVISKEALRRYGTRTKGCAKVSGPEDVEWGRCMKTLGVKASGSEDVLGRSRFHCFDVETFIQGTFPGWFKWHDREKAKKVHS